MKIFEKISKRDRQALGLLLVFFISLGAYKTILITNKYRLDAQRSFEEVRGLVYWLDQVIDKIKKAPQAQADPSRSFLDIVSNDFNGSAMAIKRIQPEGSDIIKVWLENVRFNDVIAWLSYLNSKYGIDVVQISVDATETEGMVNVRFTLHR